MIRVSQAIADRVIGSYGRFFEGISGIPARKCGMDVLDEEKVHDQVSVFCRTFRIDSADLRGRRLLEVGSGLGIFLAVLRRDYGVESFGIEPGSGQFGTSFQLSREILAEYGLDPGIVTDAMGEALPFPDNHFDFVFSSTVLEHTQDPRLVLSEAIRVLKPGGRMQFVFPNYGAFFEGHYAIPWIPYLSRPLGKLWVRLWGRDPSFMDSLQLTNYFKTRRWLRDHGDVRLVTFGEEVFRERMLGVKIKPWGGLGRLKRWLEIAHALRMTPLVTWVLLKLKSFDPILLSIVKNTSCHQMPQPAAPPAFTGSMRIEPPVPPP